MALSTCSSETSSPNSMLLCASPEGIIGKQLATLCTRQSNSTGLSTSIISLIASSSSLGFSARMPTP